MAGIKSPWVNVVGATIGGLALGYGLGSLYNGFSLYGIFWAVLGFVVLGWAIFDRRRFRPGTPESEGKTIE
ncbi:MAG TPA: hypothetical protein VF167_02370 [Longimicrobiaceae bacterium]